MLLVCCVSLNEVEIRERHTERTKERLTLRVGRPVLRGAGARGRGAFLMSDVSIWVYVIYEERIMRYFTALCHIMV